jgi:DNA-directed RNA polymerase specialized sigma24 family protein
VRADPDFTAYVVARWRPVVRVLVVLGQSVERAEDVAVASFARLMSDWGRLRREVDVDVELARVVLDGWVRVRGQQPAPRVPVTVPAARLLTQELEDQLALLERIVAGLDELDETTRVTVVLHHLGELDQDQVAEVLGMSRAEVGQRLSEAAHALDLVPLDPACHSAAAAIDVPAPAVDRVVSAAAGKRRRQWVVTGGVMVALALAVGVAYVVTKPDPAPTPPGALDVTEVENPVHSAWWVDGTLHLDHGTVRVADVAQLVETGVGVAYADSEGVVRSIADDGSRLSLGTLEPGSPLVSQPRIGWVAWSEPGDGDLVLYDIAAQAETGRVDGAVDLRIIGWDRDRLYFHRDGNDWSVSITPDGRTTDPVQVATPDGAFGSMLQDVSAGAELRRGGATLDIFQPFVGAPNEVPGTSGQLSPDGNYVLTHSGDGRPSTYDARSGAPEASWFDAGWTPLAATFTAEGRIVWVVDSHDGSLGLYECQSSQAYIDSFDPQNEPCTVRVELGTMPVLAGVQPGLVDTTVVESVSATSG